jgi:cell division protein FtsL
MGPMTKNNKTQEKQRVGFRWLALILVLFCELMVHAWVRTESTQAIVRISNAQAGITKSLSYGRALSVERDRLKSDARITRIARTHLGLSPDTFNQTIYLSGEDR